MSDIKLAVNWLNESEYLVKSGEIDVDYFKFPSLGCQMSLADSIDDFIRLCGRITALKPILLHGLYPCSHDLADKTMADKFDKPLADKMIHATKTPGLSFHPTLHYIDITDYECINTVCDNIGFFQSIYDDMDFISLENVGGKIGRFGILDRTDVLSEIVLNTGCDFLLDISHAYCCSVHAGIEVYDYLKALPIEHTYEIHINGWHERGGDIMPHVKANEKAYEILEWVLNRCKPKIITIEYGRANDRMNLGVPLVNNDSMNERAISEIFDQVARIRSILQKIDKE